MEPLSIACTTCNTRLRVRDEEALGKILACPRCGGMVQVPAKPVAPEHVGDEGSAVAAVPGVTNTPNDAGLELTAAPAEPTRWPWIHLVGGGLLAVVMAALGWWLFSRGESPPAPVVAQARAPVAPAAETTPAPAPAEPVAEETVAEAPPAVKEPAADPEQPTDARGVDDANHQRLAEGLNKHATDNGEFPVGAAGTPQLPPTERLSWIATLLPYFGHEDWHAGLNFRRSWKDPQNSEITTQPLEAVVNPALTATDPAAPGQEYPPTHYVGVSGVGADAGELPADHPRAGVFGFQRHVRSADIPDGASNTIAVLGASQNLGPWSAGGAATVRPLTQAPYVNGLDGFGSGTPDGLAAGMADGSVRFFSKDVDPRVLEQMSTIAGHEALPAETPLAGPPVPAPDVSPADAPPAATVDSNPAPAPAAPTSPTAPDDEQSRALVEARLADPVLELTFTDIALADFVDFISQLSTLEITLDLDALAEAGVTPDLKLTIHLTNTTVGEAMKEGLAELGLAYTVEAGRLIVSSPRRIGGQLRMVRYRVGDLTGGDRASLDSFGELVRALVEPATWIEAGGTGTIELAGDALMVRQSDAAHYDLLVLCEKLRLARGGKPASAGDVSRFDLTSRSEQARPSLEGPLRTVNFSEGTPLVKIVEFLQDHARVNITVDWQALAQAGISREVTGTLAVEGVPFGEALDKLLAPLELDYLVVGPRTLQITSRQEVATHRDLEFHPVGDLLDESTTPDAILARLTEGLSPSAAGSGPQVVARFDKESAHVLFLAPQAVQREVEGRLIAWRAERSAGAQVPAAATTRGTTATR